MLENKLNSFRKEQQEQESKLNKNNNKIINYFKSIYDSTVNYVTSSSTKLDNMSEEKKNKQQQDVKIMKTKTDLKKERLEHLQRVLKHQQTATSLNNNSDIDDDDDYDDDAIKSENNGFDKLTKINFILKFLLWLVLFIIFIKIEFGVVYFIISLIVGIYINTSKSRKKGILSAYSVFNPNFERLNGTFTSDHVEKSIRNTF